MFLKKSDMNTVIKVKNISKKFCKSLKHSIMYGISDIGKRILFLKPKNKQLKKYEFWALDDVSFELKKGETLGITGPNGAGKTTLLKLLSGIILPDKGSIEIRGKVCSIIEIGAGFHSLLTGRENIYINGAILGISKKEIDRNFDSIVEFADIKDFLDIPVKNYSSGMFMRLGFSIAIHSNPDIFLIDEVLSTADYDFQLKCTKKLEELKKQNKTIVIVTNNLNYLLSFTNRSLLIWDGKLIIDDTTDNVISKYKLAATSGEIS